MNVTWRNDGSGLGDIEGRDDLVIHDCVYRKPIKGAKAGQDKPRKPSIAKDSVASTSTAKLLYILGEGEIAGLVDGGKSIYLDGTPLLDDAGNSNFENVTWDFRHGTNEQDYIKGFPDVSNETPVNVELRSTQPWIKAFTDTQLSAVRIRFKWNRLSKTDPENGDVKGYKIQYAIDLQTNGGAYIEVLNTKIEDKTSAGYERTHRIDLPKSATGWQIRVRRITPNDSSEYVQDTMLIDAVAEVIDVKLRYPNTALLGLQYNAETFSGIAKMEARIRGMIIRVPANYDPVARTYTGIWDGTFKDAYTNNPAWIYFDLCTQWRYGLGDRLDITMIDKWSLYALGQYCDQMVSDGQGGLEPRFTCNVYLQKQVDAYQVLQNIGGIFRAMSYWNGERIVLDADVPQDPVYTFSRANVIDGNFEYTGTRARDRHTLAKVAWDNPLNRFETEYEYIRDEKAMAKFGVKVLDLSAFGCTSQAQAQRAGLWALKTEQLETRQVSFGVGLDGFIPQVGNIINVSDELFAGRANGGRVSAVSDAQYVVTVDRDVVANAGDVLIVNGGGGQSERRTIKSVAGRKITLNAAFTAVEAENVWAIETAELKLMRFRVMSITKSDETTFAITAIQHEPQKYDAIDFGTDVKPTDITIVNPDVVDAPASVTITSRHRVVQGQTITTLIIGWAQVKDAVAYDVEWRKDDGTWVKVPRTGNVSVEIEGVYSGNYLARVRSVSAFDVQSQPTMSMLTEIKGKVGLPLTIVGLTATGILFGMEIKWGFASGSGDAAYTEIETGSAPNTNVKLLGQYSYPTNTHTVTGLQGNLSQSYRARLVDKLGFKSAWSNWVTGKTDASADKVIDLIQGQIDESALNQALRSEIGKIDTNKTILDNLGVDLNANLAETKASVSAAQADITTAKSNIVTALNKADTALANANTNKINLASVNEAVSKNKTDVDLSISTLTTKDISLTNLYTALKSEYDTNKAKVVLDLKTLTDKDTALASLITTLDSDYKGNKATVSNSLATLTNKDTALTNSLNSLTTTVGNNTTDISNETTARSNADSALSTRITSNTTKTDNALARISTAETAIASNTQSIAATKTELKAEFDRIEVGGRNLFSLENSVNAYINSGELTYSSALHKADERYISINANASLIFQTWNPDLINITNTNRVAFYDGNKSFISQVQTPTLNGNNYVVVKTKAPSNAAFMRVGFIVSGNSKSKAELGTVATDWTPAPEDLDKSISNNTAAITSEAVARANADTVLSNRVTTAQSKADSAFSKITTAEGTIASNTQAIATTKTELKAEFAAKVDWQILTSVQDLNNMLTQGNYFIKVTRNVNAPITNWLYVVVDVAAIDRITQTIWADNNASLRYTRTIADAQISEWEKSATGTEIAAVSAAITAEAKVAADANSATAAELKTVSAKTNGNSSAIQTLNETTAGLNTAIASSTTTLRAEIAAIDIGGTNLVSSQQMQNGYINVNTGEIVLHDSPNSAQDILTDYIKVKKGENYIASAYPKNNAVLKDINTDVYVHQFNNSKTWIAATFQAGAVGVVNQLKYKATQDGYIRMSAKGSLQHDYKIERGVYPTGWTPAPEDVTPNQNLFALSDCQAGYESNGSITSGSDKHQTMQTLVPILGGQDMVFQCWNPTKVSTGNSNRIAFYTANKTYISSETTITPNGTPYQKLTRATPANARWARIGFIVGDTGIDSTISFKAEQSFATSWTPSPLDAASGAAAIQETKKVVAGVSAQYTLKLDVGGRVSGFGLASSATQSDFAINADRFWIAPPTGTSRGKSPFMVLTSPQTINGTVVPAGTYMDSTFIHKAAIDTLQVKDGAIKSAQIDDLAVTRGKIANLAVDTLQIAGNAVTIPRVQNFTGDISLTGNDARAGYTFGNVTLDAQGGSVTIQVMFSMLGVIRGSGGDIGGQINIETMRNGISINTFSIAFLGDKVHQMITTPVAIDTPPAGNNTYSVKVSVSSTGTPTLYFKEFRSIHIMGVKR